MTTKTYPLQNGTGAIPAIGLGTWQSSANTTRDAVKHALQHGYRHIDTALNYGNEREVGEGIRASGIPRDQIWVTTKLDNHWHHRVREGLDASLRALGLDYLDLYLVHFPCSTDPEDRGRCLPDWDFVKTWYGMHPRAGGGMLVPRLTVPAGKICRSSWRLEMSGISASRISKLHIWRDCSMTHPARLSQQ